MYICLSNWKDVDYLRFRPWRSSGLWQEQVSSPFSSVDSRRVVAAVAWADGTAPAACSAQLENASWNTYNACKQGVYVLKWSILYEVTCSFHSHRAFILSSFTKKKNIYKWAFISWRDWIQSELTPTLVSAWVYPVPFHGASVHFLFVVEQTVGCAGDRNGGVQAQRFSCCQNQLTLQL